MRRIAAFGAPLAILLAACARQQHAPLSADHARAIADSLRTTLVAYADRLNAADRDSSHNRGYP